MINTDLHIHSNKSDGILSPEEIVLEAIKNNVTTISITDHDTIKAYTPKLIEFAKKNNITLITGVEISTIFNNVVVHILAYNFDIHNKKLNETLDNSIKARITYLNEVTDKLNSLGYKVNTKYLSSLESITKAHIAKDIVSNLENEKVLKENFNYIPNLGEFIEAIMNKGCLGYIEKPIIHAKELGEIIKEAGGKIYIAHPVVYVKQNKLTNQDIVNLIKEIKADGLESNYIYINTKKEVINKIDNWNDFSKEHNLYTSVGSDFHKFDNTSPLIGFKDYKINLTEEEIKVIINNILN